MSQERLSPGYQLSMLVLCLYVLGVMALEAITPFAPEVKQILDWFDSIVCLIFFIDFLVMLWVSDNKKEYILKWGWLDLLSAIPDLSIARLGRLTRIFRIFRILRGLRATRILAQLFLKDKAKNSLLGAMLGSALLLVFCSVAILEFETVPESNIKTAEDAVWWAFCTITTAGYGDKYPVTSEGRFVAVILMCAGVGMFSVFSGSFAAWFLSKGNEP